MDRSELSSLMQETGAIIRNSHIVYASGKHGSEYVNKDRLFVEPVIMKHGIVEPLTRLICDKWLPSLPTVKSYGLPRVIVGPAVAGAILAHAVAQGLAFYDPKIKCVYADKTSDGNYEFKRGYGKFIEGQEVLIVEDVLTTGSSVRKVIEAVAKAGGAVAGVAAIVNRGHVSFAPIPLVSLLDLNMESWEECDCPLCRDNVPINTEVGKGREYLAKKGVK